MQIGVGQTWQSVSRSANTSYQNTTDRPILVQMGAENSTEFQVSDDNSTWIVISFSPSGGDKALIGGIVPVGWYYRVNRPNFANWVELR